MVKESKASIMDAGDYLQLFATTGILLLFVYRAQSVLPLSFATIKEYAYIPTGVLCVI